MQKKRVKGARLDPVKQGQLAKAVQKLSKEIGEKYKIEGIGTIDCKEVECIGTGFSEIDDVLSGRVNDDGEIIKGSGRGFPRGRVVEIFGPEAAAKTTLAMCVIAQAQSNGEICAFIDAEQALDTQYIEKVIGVNTKELIIMSPDSGNQALDATIALAKEGVSVIVVDSVSALVSQEELDGGKALGMQARMMSKACRELTAVLRPGGPLIIFINQIRYKIGVVFGNPEITSGGAALKFYSSVRCRVKKKEALKKTKEGVGRVIGTRIEMEVVKNKVGACNQKVIFDVKYNKGISVPKMRGRKKKVSDDEVVKE